MADFFNELINDEDSGDDFEGFSSEEDENDLGEDAREGEIRIDDNFMQNGDN